MRYDKESREKIRKSKIGAKNPQWVSVNPSYGSVHIWLTRNFSKIPCEFCQSQRFVEWSLKKGKKHDHIRSNYFCLCSSCHKKYDYTEERRKKLSDSLKKVPRTAIWLKRMSESLMGHPISLEQRRKQSIYQKTHPRPRNSKGQFFSTKHEK